MSALKKTASSEPRMFSSNQDENAPTPMRSTVRSTGTLSASCSSAATITPSPP